MDEIRNAFTVPFEYRVIFSDRVLAPESPVLAGLMAADGAERARAVVFLDRGLAELNPAVTTGVASYFAAHGDSLELAAEPQLVAGGEEAKRDLRGYERCVAALHEARLGRHSYTIAIGGGAVLDAVGFAASTVHRGVRQIRIPTTVLAQNDAGIGVKNGIDYRGTKNFLGCFSPPHAVVNDFTLLRTLTPSAWRDGLAEAVKVALIRDAQFFSWIETHAADLAAREEQAMRLLIRRCAELHLAHITGSGDPFERGSARPLDFGHWSAHRLEQLSGFTVRHGQAVAVGMAIDTFYASAIGLLNREDCRRIIDCLARLGFALNIGPEAGIGRPDQVEALLRGIADFQEHLGGELSLTMLRRIGAPIEVHELQWATLKQCCARVLWDHRTSESHPQR